MSVVGLLFIIMEGVVAEDLKIHYFLHTTHVQVPVQVHTSKLLPINIYQLQIREIMCLVASVYPFVYLSVCLPKLYVMCPGRESNPGLWLHSRFLNGYYTLYRMLDMRNRRA